MLSSIGNSMAVEYDRAKEVREFHKSRAGVKGLVDSGMVKIPRMFIHEAKTLSDHPVNNHLQIPVVNLIGLGFGKRMEVVEQVRQASETWGFFQVINHLIPPTVMDELLESVKKFHEQPVEMKKELYSCDQKRTVRFYSDGIFEESQPANWRDTLEINFPDGMLDTNSFPAICRKEILEYLRCLARLKETLCVLLSEALGLSREYLPNIECMKSGKMVCHYFPDCAESHLTLGSGKHWDPVFLTILLQDNLGGLQVLHQNQWVDVHPTRGALVVNIGDLMQLISNDKFKSVEHRVLAKPIGPRLSVTCFFDQSSKAASEPFGPIKELLSVANPPVYHEILGTEYKAFFRSKGMDGSSALSHFRLDQRGWMPSLSYHILN